MQKWSLGFTRHPTFGVLILCAALCGCLGSQLSRGDGADRHCFEPEEETLLLGARKAREAVSQRQVRIDVDGDGQADAAVWWLVPGGEFGTQGSTGSQPTRAHGQDAGGQRLRGSVLENSLEPPRSALENSLESSLENIRRSDFVPSPESSLESSLESPSKTFARAPYPPQHHRSELFWNDPQRGLSAASLWEIEISAAQLQRLSGKARWEGSELSLDQPPAVSPASDGKAPSPKLALHRAHYLRKGPVSRRQINLASRHALPSESAASERAVPFLSEVDEGSGGGAREKSSQTTLDEAEAGGAISASKKGSERAETKRAEEGDEEGDGESETLGFREQRPEQNLELVLLDVPQDEKKAIVRRRIEMNSKTGTAILTESFDRDRDGFYGFSRQRIISRVRPWEEHGTVVLPEGIRGCSNVQRQELERALELALVHGAACLRGDRGESLELPDHPESSESAESPASPDHHASFNSPESPDHHASFDSPESPAHLASLNSPESSDHPQSSDLASSEPPEPPAPTSSEDSQSPAKSAESELNSDSDMQSLEWLWLHARHQVEFACLSVSICGAVDQLDVGLSWLDQAPVVLALGVDAFQEKRCGPLPALLGRLIRYYDPADFSFDEGAYEEFQQCIADRSRKTSEAMRGSKKNRRLSPALQAGCP